MSTDLISKTRTVMLVAPTEHSGYSANTDGTEADIGSAREGLLIVCLDAGVEATDVLDNFALYTDSASAFTAGTAASRVVLTQNVSDSVNAVTFTTSEVTAGFSSDGVYVFEAQDLKRYVNVQYDVNSDGTNAVSRYTVALVTTNLGEAPYKPYTSAY